LSHSGFQGCECVIDRTVEAVGNFFVLVIDHVLDTVARYVYAFAGEEYFFEALKVRVDQDVLELLLDQIVFPRTHQICLQTF